MNSLGASQVQSNVNCYGSCNGSASVYANGGIPPYNYSWSPSGGTFSTASSLCAGTYTCVIQDFGGNVISRTFNITEPSAFSTSIGGTSMLSCFGMTNGWCGVSVSGGTTPYTYDWSPGSPTGDGTATISGLSSGVYFCLVTDANGCTVQLSRFIDEPPPVLASLASQTNVNCNGGANGAASVSASGGVGTYWFNWAPGNPTGQGSSNVSNLTAGTWTCTIGDFNGCTTTQTVNITQPPTLVVAYLSDSYVLCFGGNSGTAAVSVSGGTGAYSYNWTPGNPPGDGTASVTGLTAGTWTCTVTDANGCVATRTFNITQPPPLSVNTVSQTNVLCNGAATGAATVVAGGGLPAYTYNWTPGNPIGDGTATATSLTAGSWMCTVTDSRGCTNYRIFNITQPSAIVVTTLSQTNNTCNGGNNGAASINPPSGGVGPYSYNWSPGNPIGDGTTAVTGLTAGTWTCTVTDFNACIVTQTFNITQPIAITGSIGHSDVSCFGGSNANAGLSVGGGNPPYSYDWSPGNPTGDGTTSVSGLSAGTWSCTVTDANSCSATITVNITQPPMLVASASSQTNISCNGGSNGAASVSVSGGTTSYSFNWTPGNPTGDGTSGVTGLTAGIWTCTVTDANACVATQTFNITAPSAPLVATVTQTYVSCFGGSDGSATASVSGGTPGYTYSWAPVGGTSATATGLTPNCHTVTVTDANGCVVTQTVCISQPAQLTVSNASQTNVSCNGGSNGAASVNVSGGTTSYSYNWTPGNPAGDGTASVTGLSAQTYTCTVTDANLCVNSSTISITEPPVLSAASSATSIACNGGNATITVSGSGGTSPYTGTGMFTVVAGTYSFTVTDANGCTNTSTITVTEPTALLASSSATSITCNGGNATVTVTSSGGTSPYTGEGTFTEFAGTYSYVVTDANGCTSTTTISITEPTAISASVTSVNVGCNGDSTGSIDLTVSGGTSPYTFDWNSGAYTTEDISGLGVGTYVGVLTDANGCTDGGTVVITEPTALVASLTTVTDPTSCGGTDGSVDITVSGGTIGYSFLWNTSATTEDLSGIGAGAYNCAVTDTNGCVATVNASLNDPNAPTVTLTVTVDTLCSTDAAFTLTGESPAGGTFSGPGVSAGTFDPAIAGIGMHIIGYTYTDINGCTGSTTDSIYVDICMGTLFAVQSSPFTVFPNPNNGAFTLQLNTTLAADVMIYDAQGKLVNAQKVQPNVQTQMSVVESGMYMITVVTADGQRTSQRVIVNR